MNFGIFIELLGTNRPRN